MADTQSCHTYEDQATQTEDEDDNDQDLTDVAVLPYGRANFNKEDLPQSCE